MKKHILIVALLLSLTLIAGANENIVAITPQATSNNSTINDTVSMFPLTAAEMMGIVIILLVGGLANSTGNGGGALFTSILLIFFPYSPTASSGLVYNLIFGGCLGNYINIVRRRNPKTGKPLIDYDLILLCLPPMLLGSSIGGLLGRIVPQAIFIVGVVIVAILSSTNLYQKIKKQWKEETNEKLLNDPTTCSETELQILDQGQAKTEQVNFDPQLQEVLIEEQKIFPRKKYLNLALLMSLVMLAAVFRGTDKTPSIIGLKYCSSGYWSLYLIGLMISGVFLVINKNVIEANIELKKRFLANNAVEVPNIDTTFQLSIERVRKLYVLMIITGFIARFLSMGGGMLMTPLFISVGISPHTVAATSGLMVMLSGLVSLFQALLYRDAPLKDAMFFLVIMILGSFTVSYALNWLVRLKGRPSILLIAFLIVLAISVPATPAYTLWKNSDNLGKLFEFHSIC